VNESANGFEEWRNGKVVVRCFDDLPDGNVMRWQCLYVEVETQGSTGSRAVSACVRSFHAEWIAGED
jgi:hypothetical protein